MRRKQFTFYTSFWESIENLQTNKEKLQAYQLICGYALTGIEPDLNVVKPCAATVFRIARPVLDTASSRAQKLLEKNKCMQLVTDDAQASKPQ